MKEDDIYFEIIDFIEKNHRFLLCTHVSPEGDALGSQLALTEVLESMGKEVVLINAHPVPKRYTFLPGIHKVYCLKDYNIMTKDRDFSELAVIIMDCPNIERIGEIRRMIEDNQLIANIDHHPGNSYFGKVNLVDSHASSTCNILFKLFKEMDVNITPAIATNLYAGILIDTGCFRHKNTTSETHNIIAELIMLGADPEEISIFLYERWPAKRFKLLSKVLDTIELKFEGKYAFMVVTSSMLEETETEEDLCEDFIDFSLSISNVEVAAFFKERQEYIKVSLRSKKDYIDVNKLASKYNGGGHERASGCKIKGSLEDVKKYISNDIKKILK